MLTRELYLKQIADHFAFLQLKIQLLGIAHYYDIHTSAEYFVRDTFNVVLGTKLQVVDAVFHRNYPGIDLADATSGLAVQVSASTGVAKVKHTLEKFVAFGLQQQYPRLIIFMLQRRQPKYKITVPNGVTFDPNEAIWDFTTLYDRVNKLQSSEQVRELAEYVASSAPMPQDGQETRSRLSSVLSLFEREVFFAPLDREDPVEMLRAIRQVRISLQRSDAVLLLDQRLIRVFRDIREVLAQYEHDLKTKYPVIYSTSRRAKKHIRGELARDDSYWEATRLLIGVREAIASHLQVAYRELDRLK